MKIIINLFAFIFINSIISQNLLKGKVIDNLKRPLVGVNILLKGTNKGVDTDLDGNFKIDNISGKQTLIITSVGYKTREVAVEAPNKNIIITLYEGNELLQEVEIVSRNNTFSRKRTAYVSKLPLKDIENSQVYTTVTNELLESQVTINIDDALKNATGVHKLWDATARNAGSGSGFYSIRGFYTQSNLVDGVPGYTFSNLDPSYIERIEVIKGPSATLMGSINNSLAGQINIITKKPHEGKSGSISYTGGSFDTHRVSVDYNTPLAGKNSPYFRVNASYLTKGTWQDVGFSNTYFIAPVLSYRANNRLNFKVGLEFSKTKQTNTPMVFLKRGLPLTSHGIADLKFDSYKSYTSDNIHLTTPTFNTRFITDYKISNKWTSQTIFASSYSEAYGYYQYLLDGAADAVKSLQLIKGNKQLKPVLPFIGKYIDPMVNEANTMLERDLFTRIFKKTDENQSDFTIQQNFKGDFKIGQLRNRIVIGLDYTKSNTIDRGKSQSAELLKTSNFPQILNFFNNPPSPPIPNQFVSKLKVVGEEIARLYSNLPYFDAYFTPDGNVYKNSFTPNATYAVNKNALDNVFDKVSSINSNRSKETLSAYVSNVLNILPTLNINIGGRIDYFMKHGEKNNPNDDYTRVTFSPKAGVVFQPILNKVAVFGNYQTGYVNVDPKTIDGRKINSQLTKSQQLEGGIKTNLFSNKLNLGVNYYYIIVNGSFQNDPEVRLIPTPVQIEEIISKGFEVELNAMPLDGLNIRGGYSYNNAKITDATVINSTKKRLKPFIEDIEGLRPSGSGAKFTYNFWLDYKFREETFLNNFGIGAGLNGASEVASIETKKNGKFMLPSYTIYNASLYYDIKNFKISLKANNIANKEYYSGWQTIIPQAPRAFLGTVTYKF